MLRSSELLILSHDEFVTAVNTSSKSKEINLAVSPFMYAWRIERHIVSSCFWSNYIRRIILYIWQYYKMCDLCLYWINDKNRWICATHRRILSTSLLAFSCSSSALDCVRRVDMIYAFSATKRYRIILHESVSWRVIAKIGTREVSFRLDL